MQNAKGKIFADAKIIYKNKTAGKFSSTFFKRWQSSRQRLDSMRELKLAPPRFKITKLRFGILDRVDPSRLQGRIALCHPARKISVFRAFDIDFQIFKEF